MEYVFQKVRLKANSDGMKLIIIVVNDTKSETLLNALLVGDFPVTRIASTGGFMRRGNSTLIMDVRTGRLQSAI